MKRLSATILAVIVLALSLSPVQAQPFASPFVSPLHSGDKVRAMGYQHGPRKVKQPPAYLDYNLNPWAFIFIRWSK